MIGKPFSYRLRTVFSIVFVVWLVSCQSAHIFSGRVRAESLEPGNVAVPLGEEGRAATAVGDTARDLIDLWACKELPPWDYHGAKVNAPRIILAKLAAGADIDEVNDYLLNTAVEPWSGSGSTWLLRRGGDYDFSEVPLTAILYQFGDRPELLYPETKEHLLHTLLIESGDRVRPSVPGSFRLVPDTENHILMTEGSRYLKNQWLRSREGMSDGKYDNRENGVEAFLMDFMDELIRAGLFEFNSLPYSGYTLAALMNLEAFAEDPVASKARELLDTIMFKYALGSLDMRRCAPFRRQPEKAGTTSVQADDASQMSRIWISMDDPFYPVPPVTERLHQAMYAALMPYRIPRRTLDLIKEKNRPYFVQLGRGPDASPEIYSTGPGYLLSAGGASRGRRSMIVARPTTLLLSDGAEDYRDCFRLTGRGSYREWNNTGVFRDFACSDSPVLIPSRAEPAAAEKGWRIYRSGGSTYIAVFNGEGDHQCGILALFPDYTGTAEDLAQSLSQANPEGDRLSTEFRWPGGDCVGYDLNAPKGTWVISSFNGEDLNRNYDSWPVINSLFPGDN